MLSLFMVPIEFVVSNSISANQFSIAWEIMFINRTR